MNLKIFYNIGLGDIIFLKMVIKVNNSKKYLNTPVFSNTFKKLKPKDYVSTKTFCWLFLSMTVILNPLFLFFNRMLSLVDGKYFSHLSIIRLGDGDKRYLAPQCCFQTIILSPLH